MFVAEDKSVRDHNHVTGKCRGSDHWTCDVNLKLTKKIPTVFLKLKNYVGHLIMQKIGKFDVTINVANRLEKYMAFSCPDKWVNNFSDDDFKYLSQEFTDEYLELVKTKWIVSILIYRQSQNSFDKILPDSFLKNECICEKDYMHVIHIWSMFKMKTMSDYHDLY